MPQLERICEAINEENTDAQFRMWMTSMPSTDFPPNILQVWWEKGAVGTAVKGRAGRGRLSC